MNTPVSFHTAKLLKEKGFEGKYIGYYRNYGKNLYYSCFTDMKFPERFRCTQTPTIAEVVMWLYEKYNIWIIAVPSTTSEGLWYYHRFDINNPDNNSEPELVDKYKSPTEAYEAAIEYTLKNLI